jgi:hypothetical protein
MGEVTTDTDPFFVSLSGRAISASMVIAELDTVVGIVADGLRALPPAVDLAEQRPGEMP